MASTYPVKTTYLPHIDGLRALAVMSVIVYHLDAAWLPRGYLGVDIFFVISGFVVSLSVSHWAGMRLGPFLLAFYARRLMRIMPALVVCLLATFVLSALFIPPGWLSDGNERTGRYAFWGLANWALARGGNDYFSPRTEFNPFTHTWSLGVEEQFYLVFPLVFVAWLQMRQRLSVAVMLLGVGGSLAAYVWMSQRAPGDAFYLSWFRFWQLGAGVLLFQLWQARRSGALGASAGAGAWAWAGLAALAAALWAPVPGAQPWWPNLLAVLGALALMAGGVAHSGVLGRVLTHSGVRWVGKISYSLYLWHWPVFVLARWTVGLDDPWTRGLALLLTFVLGWASFRWLEQPLRGWGEARRKGPVVAGSLLAVGLAAALAHGIVDQRDSLSLSVVSRQAADWSTGHPDAVPRNGPCESGMEHHQQGSLSEVVFKPVLCGPHAAPAGRLFVLGDSHAMHLHALYVGLARSEALQTHVYGAGGCAYLGLSPVPAHCHDNTRQAMQRLQTDMRAGDVLLLSSLRVRRMVDQWAHFNSPEGALAEMRSAPFVQERERQVMAALPELQALVARGVHIVLPAPTPVFRTVPYRCADGFNRNNPICRFGGELPREQMAALQAPALEAFAQLQAGLGQSSVWNPLDVLCPGPVCSTQLNGRPLLFDGDHLSGHGNALLLPHFTAHLRRIGLLR
jgi:peptidoglycan/LPS O-acetylase OafA/YrhL